MADFNTAVTLVLKQEGGGQLVFDNGGATKFGISAHAFPNVDVPSLKQGDAIALYRQNYWRFDALTDQRLANLMLSLAVNQGLGTAILTLQKVTGMVMDGKWGAITEGAANNTPDVLRAVASAALVHYARIAESQQNDCMYLGGWVNRVLQCLW